jgi:hypothetical protein
MKKAQDDQHGTAKPAPDLTTEGPLFGKDQQGMAIERSGKLGQEALLKWRRLKEVIRHPFKK